MQITFDTNSLTELDHTILALLNGNDAPTPAVKAAAPAPAKKAAAKPAPADEPDDAPPSDSIEPVLQDAVDLATKLVSEGKAKDVKAALTDLGVKRVKELEGDDIAAFISALS